MAAEQFELCDLEGCAEKVGLRCESCSRSLCLKHRHAPDHNCEPSLAATAIERAKVASKEDKYAAAVEKAAATSAAATEHRQQRKKSKPLTAKKQKTAAMVQLMVLKQKATGKKTIATCERYYLTVLLDQGEPHPITATHGFFQKTAKVGRMLDEALVLANAPTAGKYLVSNAADGTTLRTGTSLAELDGVTLHNGSAVVISTLEASAVQDRLELYQAALKR